MDIRKRKTRLKDDLELLEGSFEQRLNKVKSNVFGSFQPATIIKKKPLKAVGIALIAGIALGISRGRKKSGSSDDETNGSSSAKSVSKSPGFTGILYDEVKRIAARKTAAYLSDFVDQKLSERNNNSS